MPDPIEDLENFDPRGIAMNKLSAAEVRRRGDRLRRRNHGIAALGVTAVVLAVAGVGVGTQYAMRSDAPAPATSVTPSPTDPAPTDPQPTDPAPSNEEGEFVPLTQIPESFDLADGLPGTNADGTPVRVGGEPRAEVNICPDTPLLDTSAAVDRAGVERMGTDNPVARSLFVFPDAATAASVLTGGEDVLAGCEGDSGYVLRDRNIADGSLVVTHTWLPADDTGVDVIQVIRVGNALLVTTEYRELEDKSDVALNAFMDDSAEQVKGVVEQMAFFAGGDPGSADPAGGASATVPEDFPIDEGLEDYEISSEGGITGPSANSEAGIITPTCWPTDLWSPQSGRDTLAVRSMGPEIFEARELRVLGSAQEASTQMDRIREAVEACSTPEDLWTVHEAEVGYADTFSFSQTAADRRPGGAVWQFTRVGRAILVVESGGETSLDGIKNVSLPEVTAATRLLTPHMCVFTEAGC